MNKLFTYLGTAIVPVFLTWALGYVTFPDSINLIDYSVSGTELINAQEKLTSSLKIQANDKPIEKLSIYNIRFANYSSKNLQKVQVEFKVKLEPGTELLASAIKGPQNYSDSLLKKTGETKTSVTYTIDFINVASKNSGEYFTASLLFSGSPPVVVTPISLTPGVGFIDAKENNKENIVAAITLALVIIAYIAFIWWAIVSGKKEGKARREQFEQNLTSYFAEKLSLSSDSAMETTKAVLIINDRVFKPDSWLKKKLKNWLSS